ncbi:hypothetical protein BCR39DRAFT_518178 [Naematelia encephala]|uniref:Rab-GAP TBC domain-containing protein n=1 Tax=Naematelia encephala TaxID=71784 RepID=A0A1Y2BGT9_9TREE|nr:hypothetical protein BCR39DRAFT_518178 [Naematelia encephala]
MSTNLQDYVELLNAEQYVQVDKLRENARHGIAPRVRGEVWLYLLSVLVPDKTSEITSLLSLNSTYQALPLSMPSNLTSLLLKTALNHHTKRFFNPTYAGLISSITAEPETLSSSTSPMFLAENHKPPPPLRLSESDGTTLRSENTRLLPPPPSSPPSRHGYMSMMEEVLGKFYHAELARGHDEEYRRGSYGLEDSERDWVYLATPFMCCLSRPVAVSLGFQKLMQRLESFPSLPSRIASLVTLFRLSLPELFAYFEDEQVPYIDVAMSWSKTLLAREMWLGNVLRLWGKEGSWKQKTDCF